MNNHEYAAARDAAALLIDGGVRQRPNPWFGIPSDPSDKVSFALQLLVAAMDDWNRAKREAEEAQEAEQVQKFIESTGRSVVRPTDEDRKLYHAARKFFAKETA